MQNLVYAELSNGVTFEMLNDKKVLIISDNAIFLVTTTDHKHIYPDEIFYAVTPLARKEYEIREENGRIVSDLYPKRSM